MNKILIRLVAIYLWWFSIVFILVIGFSSISFLAEGTFLGDTLIRRPYQWDFELMFTVLFFIWGIFLWRSSTDIKSNKTFINFTAWALLTHGLVFIAIGLLKPEILTHAILDSIWWIAAGVIMFKASKTAP